MQNIEHFVKERQEIKPLQTCESYFLAFQQNCCRVSVIIFALQKTVQVDTMFYPDTDEMQMWNNVTLDCPLDNIALKSHSVRCAPHVIKDNLIFQIHVEYMGQSCNVDTIG